LGNRGPEGTFGTRATRIARRTEIRRGRALVNGRAACPNNAFAAAESQERVPDSEKIRTFRVSLNLLGDGFVEAGPGQTFVDLAREQCQTNHKQICGQVLYLAVLESHVQTAVVRFGWKDQ